MQTCAKTFGSRIHKAPLSGFSIKCLGLAASLALGACNSNGSGTQTLVAGQCAVALPAVLPLEKSCERYGDERIDAMGAQGIGLTSELNLPPGRYALPATDTPSQLVVMFHGHQNDSCSWRSHLREVAAQGAVAVAMDYSDQDDLEVDGFGFVHNWGWAVRSGARDSIAAAQYFLDRYPSISQVFNFSVSMGGNVGGYANYWEGAKKVDCQPMWDYWVVAEGVHNLTEEYLGARTLSSANATAAQAVVEIEEENGGPFEELPVPYSEITNVLHAQEMAYLKGVVLTHGTVDQTVPYDQSRQMTDQFRALGVPAHFFTVPGSDHVWEGNGDAAVIRTALDELLRLMAGGEVSDMEDVVLP